MTTAADVFKPPPWFARSFAWSCVPLLIVAIILRESFGMKFAVAIYFGLMVAVNIRYVVPYVVARDGVNRTTPLLFALPVALAVYSRFYMSHSQSIVVLCGLGLGVIAFLLKVPEFCRVNGQRQSHIAE